jgi:hypothetical protein
MAHQAKKVHTRLSQLGLTRQVKIVILLISFENASRQKFMKNEIAHPVRIPSISIGRAKLAILVLFQNDQVVWLSDEGQGDERN